MVPRVAPRLLAAGALVIAVALLALVVTADNVVTRADLDLVRSVAADRSALVADVARAASWLGNVLVLGSLSATAAWILHRRGAAWSRALLPAGALATAAIVDPLAKLAVGRPRPPAELAELVETATGYPSGHSAQSAAFWVALAYAVSSDRVTRRRALAAATVLIFAVGLSRVVLGVHSPTDVLGGWALGLACALVAIEISERLGRRGVARVQTAGPA